MPRHGERIHKRKDGRWEGRYKIGNSETGQTKYASVYGKSYAEAKYKLSMIEGGDYSVVKSTNQKLFSYAIQQWFLTNQHKFKKSTMARYEYLINAHIIPDLGSIKINTITAIMLNNFAEYKLAKGSLSEKGGLSKSYVRSMMLIISSVMKFAAIEGWCMPLKSEIYKPSPDKKDLKILTSNQQFYAEENLYKNFSPTAAGILITLQAGLRIGEVCALEWDNVDFINKIIHIRSTVTRIKNPYGNKPKTILVIGPPKTKSSIRDIPISERLCNYLIDLKKISNSSFVVSTSQTFVSTRTFEYRYHKIMDCLDIPNLNFHALRHSFATRCIEYGVDIKSLSEILGHSNVSITLNTYVHSSIELKRIQLSKIYELSA